MTTDELARVDMKTPRFELVPAHWINQSTTPDPAVEETILEDYKALFPDAIVLGRTDVDWDLRKKTIRGGESHFVTKI